jgi:tight adherence protein C
MPFLSALALFGSIVLFAYWRTGVTNTGATRMRALAPRSEAPSDPEEPFFQRVVLPFLRGVASRGTELLPTALISQVQRWLLVSDSTISLSTFSILTLGFATVFPIVYLAMVFLATGGPPVGPLWLGLPAITVLGAAFPVMTLRRRAMERQDHVLKALPESLDLLTTCVEAGLSLDYAFQRVADRQTGPVSDEINRMLREKALGKTRRDALTALAERIDLPDVNVFVQSVIQAEHQGTSIAGVLRTQSRQLRIRRRQRAEEAAQQAGPKMVFPLVFFVLPSLFIVVLGPVAIDVWGGFGGF